VLHPGPVASQQQGLPVKVQDSQREHAVQPLQALASKLLVQVHDGLGVGPAAEAMPARGLTSRSAL
jgi:hypothetical protein